MVERMARGLAPAALVAFVVIGAVSSRQDLVVVLGAAAVAMAAVPFLQSTRWPLLATAAVVSVAVGVLCSGSAANLGWFGLCVLAGWCSLRGGTALGVAFTGFAAAIFVLQWTVFSSEPGWGTWIAGTVFTTVVCLMARRQRDLIDQLRAAQAGLADRTRAEERNRIARELHDVIGHALTVSLLHVSSARLAIEDDPDEAVAALAEAERLGQQSLAEVRQAVGLLREGSESTRTPLPGAEQLPSLVEGFRQVGARVAYDVVGDPSALPATAALALYRILQEGLTNAARHAPGAETTVRMEVTPGWTVLTIDSGGTPGATNEHGVGLRGMRERAEALGGELSAGPSATGWRVRAVLPVATQPIRVELG